ncbi:MAG: hypothetical protein HN392_07810 [Anaerolineae bacterium]|jgi:hypothetical protein|nr:hypothetical protein [Anaerolineae bacterium]MBT7074576.1 hypothetical protein [Anaerolineae bacterium]MBT7783002.1 hypothetical protein [Anaerolineae bacterium]
MSERANALAERIEQGAEALAGYVEGFTASEWKMIVPGEERSVGVLVHHVASSYQAEVDLASELASGKPIAGVTMDVIDGINADHAKEFAQVAKEDVLTLLRENSKVAADRVRKFTDSELDNANKVSLNANAPLTTQFFLEDHALRHSFTHLESIRERLGK